MSKKVLHYTIAFLIAVIVFFTINGTITALSPYSPKPQENISVSLKKDGLISKKELKILTFNTSHASLGSESDLKKEGGKGKRQSAEIILKNARGIAELVNLSNSDAVFLQDVDEEGYRSRYVNQLSYYTSGKKYNSAFASTFKTRSTSFMFPNKKLYSGTLTLSKNKISEAKRISLPLAKKGFSAEKVCMLVTALPIKDSDSNLVLINANLDPYAPESIQKEQLSTVISYARKLFENGDYVIIGGSLGRRFEGTRLRYPLSDKNKFTPNIIYDNEIPSGWTLSYDTAIPSARILSSPYENTEERQVYISDGFILSPNISAKMTVTVDQEFRYSSHNPVLITISLN